MHVIYLFIAVAKKLSSSCSDGEIYCWYNGQQQCLPNSLKCDGTRHCYNGEDEGDDVCSKLIASLYTLLQIRGGNSDNLRITVLISLSGLEKLTNVNQSAI